MEFSEWLATKILVRPSGRNDTSEEKPQICVESHQCDSAWQKSTYNNKRRSIASNGTMSFSCLHRQSISAMRACVSYMMGRMIDGG